MLLYLNVELQNFDIVREVSQARHEIVHLASPAQLARYDQEYECREYLAEYMVTHMVHLYWSHQVYVEAETWGYQLVSP